MILLAIIIIIILAVLWSLYKAPEGYEAEDGFHFGKPDLRIMDKSTKKNGDSK